MKKIDIFVDGSSLGNPGFGGWCAILRFKAMEKILLGNEEFTTNNRMELLAVIKALQILKEACKISLYSDSKYVVDGISEYLPRWIEKNFIEVKNPDLWRQYIAYARPHEITANWVKGHANHPENIRCDTLAKNEAAKLRDSKEQNIFSDV